MDACSIKSVQILVGQERYRPRNGVPLRQVLIGIVVFAVDHFSRHSLPDLGNCLEAFMRVKRKRIPIELVINASLTLDVLQERRVERVFEVESGVVDSEE